MKSSPIGASLRTIRRRTARPPSKRQVRPLVRCRDSSERLSPSAVDSIEEHFARSLAKFLPAHPDQLASVHRPTTESIVDDHFAKALGSATWEKLKERH